MIQNIDDFKFKPFISISRKDYFQIQFSDLASELFVNISQRGAVEVCIYDEQTDGWDIIAEFDVGEERNDQGFYYCSYCLEKTYYPDRVKLWQKHSFEPLLKWVNNIAEDDLICLDVRNGELSAARRWKKRDMGKYQSILEKYKDIESRCFSLITSTEK